MDWLVNSPVTVRYMVKTGMGQMKVKMKSFYLCSEFLMKMNIQFNKCKKN